MSLPGAVYLSEIQEHAKDCISWMRFFSPALFGVTSIAKAKQVQITELSEHSQLRKAGIVENDIVLAVGKAQIATEREFRDSLRMQITTGRTEFTIRRANMVMTFSVALK